MSNNDHQPNASQRNDDVARAILDDNSYVVLATADAGGTPWASPVWFAQEDYRHLYWVSAPDSQHSMNIAARPSIAMVVFDSSVPEFQGQAVYMTATAALVDDPADGIAVVSRASQRHGQDPWDTSRVSGDARLRLYRAEVIEHWILDPDAKIDVRISVHP